MSLHFYCSHRAPNATHTQEKSFVFTLSNRQLYWFEKRSRNVCVFVACEWMDSFGCWIALRRYTHTDIHNHSHSKHFAYSGIDSKLGMRRFTLEMNTIIASIFVERKPIARTDKIGDSEAVYSGSATTNCLHWVRNDWIYRTSAFLVFTYIDVSSSDRYWRQSIACVSNWLQFWIAVAQGE